MKNVSQFLKTTEGQFVASVGIIIVLLFGYYFYSDSSSSAEESTQTITVSASDHVRGAVDGKLTLVEFGDFQCPACGAYEPIVRQVMNDHKDSLKVVFKQFPLTQIHRNALVAAKASEAAGVQGKFWEMHDVLYEKQQEWSGLPNAKETFMLYAKTLGLDVAKFMKDIDDPKIEEKILAEYKEGIRLKVQGTPTFFLNGKKLENVNDLASFDKAIQAALK